MRLFLFIIFAISILSSVIVMESIDSKYVPKEIEEVDCYDENSNLMKDSYGNKLICEKDKSESYPEYWILGILLICTLLLGGYAFINMEED